MAGKSAKFPPGRQFPELDGMIIIAAGKDRTIGAKSPRIEQNLYDRRYEVPVLRTVPRA